MLLGLLTIIPLTACLANGSPPEFKQGLLRVNDQIITVEIADSHPTRQYGLMFRDFLPKNQGMWFDFKGSSEQCMWMKNTLIDLDVAFVTENMKILNIAKMKAGTTDVHCSAGKVRYALEMNANWFADNTIAPGDAILSPIKKADQ